MPQRKAAPAKAPSIQPDRALKALTQQLEALQKLKGGKCQEAEPEKTQWNTSPKTSSRLPSATQVPN
jgi:hypothetical protein